MPYCPNLPLKTTAIPQTPWSSKMKSSVSHWSWTLWITWYLVGELVNCASPHNPSAPPPHLVTIIENRRKIPISRVFYLQYMHHITSNVGLCFTPSPLRNYLLGYLTSLPLHSSPSPFNPPAPGFSSSAILHPTSPSPSRHAHPQPNQPPPWTPTPWASPALPHPPTTINHLPPQ